MIDTLLTLVVLCLFAGIAYWIITEILKRLPIEPVFKQIIEVILLVVFLLLVLGVLFGEVRLPHLRLMG